MLCRLCCWGGGNVGEGGLGSMPVACVGHPMLIRWRQLPSDEVCRTGDPAVETPQMSLGTLHSPISCLFICLLG